MSKKLEEIRQKIDSLDNQIHDVLMERAELIEDIVAEKKKHNLQFVHPAREAVMIRRLLERHEGILPAATVVRIWRELVGAVSLLQTGLEVSVYMDEGDVSLWELSKDYFGSVIPMKKLSSPLLALAAVREGQSSFAVLPWPNDVEEEAPWWMHLLKQENYKLHIVCALPFGRHDQDYDQSESKAVVVSQIDFAPSGEDHSFVAVEINSSVSRGRLYDGFKDAGLDPVSINTYKPATEDVAYHLIELNDYIDVDDDRVDSVFSAMLESDPHYEIVGGYPVPPQFERLQVVHNEGQKEPLAAPSNKEKQESD